MNTFEHIWTCLEQVWTHLNKFEHILTGIEQALNKFEHDWTHLNTFELIWTSFEQVWTHFITFEQVLNKFEDVWTHLNTFANIWTGFEQVWTQLNTFELNWTTFSPSSLYIWKRYEKSFLNTTLMEKRRSRVHQIPPSSRIVYPHSKQNCLPTLRLSAKS